MRGKGRAQQKRDAARQQEELETLQQAITDRRSEPPEHVAAEYRKLAANPVIKDRWRMNPPIELLVDMAYHWGPNDIVIANAIVADVLVEFADHPLTDDAAHETGSLIIAAIKERCYAALPPEGLS